MTNKTKATGCAAALVAFAVLLVASGAIFTVHETEQVIVTQFGNPVGEPINPASAEKSEAGLHFKIPFVWEVNRFEKRILEWDGRAEDMPTKDKTYISVNTFARWRIADPLQFFRRLRDERSALSRLDDILGSETRNTIAKNELIEVVRSTKDRQPLRAEELIEADMSGMVGKLLPIRQGQSALEKEIFEKSKSKLTEFGVELLDVRFKRVNYNQSVQERIFERMISERQQIAERFRSEGAGEAAKILGNMEKELREIQSTAYREVETIKGQADAKASEIYATAFNQGPEAAEFYEFSRTMELYLEMLAGDSTLILSTDSDLFKYLKRIEPKQENAAPTVGHAAPVEAPAVPVEAPAVPVEAPAVPVEAPAAPVEAPAAPVEAPAAPVAVP